MSGLSNICSGMLLTTFLAIGSMLPAQPITLIPLQEEAISLRTSSVEVGDVFAVQNTTDRIANNIASIPLARFRSPGSTYNVYEFQVERSLANAGVDADVDIRGEFPIQLYAEEAQISPQILGERITRFLQDQHPGKIEWSYINDPTFTIFPGDPYEIDFPDRIDVLPGRFALRGIFLNGSYRQAFSLLLEVAVYQTVLVATETIDPGTILTAKNTSMEERPLDMREARSAISQETQVTDIEAVRHMDAGEIVLSNMIRKVQVIHPGDRVNLLVEHGGVRIESQGKAIESAGLQEKVRVRDIQSGKIVVGEVEDNNTVKVDLTKVL
ncbi:MAG TPA: flagellar basal body P-ring formation chaperone FlgA [bacterium]|nr:flagellar basal body P-ring formation chaperone FlgA [bacterium]